MTYDYQHVEATDCQNGRRFEIEHDINDDAKTVCPECGASIKRLIGAPNFKFKGGSPTPKFFE
jgi:putative FmdB family regulatory protein